MASRRTFTDDGLPVSAVHKVRGGKIAARTAGHGPAVLLLHGVGTAGGSFWAQFPALSDEYELIAWDAFGYGESSEPPTRPRLDDYADAAADLIAAHGRANAHVAGVSWGGVVATRLALRHPGRVRTLTLISSTYGRKHNETVRSGFGERIAALADQGVRNWAQARVGGLVSPGAPDELRELIVDTAVDSVRLSGFSAAARTLADTDHRADLGGVSAPTLVLCGDQDAITGPPESRVLANGIPGARLVRVPDGGHVLNQDKPDVVNDRLREHWRGFDDEEGEQA